MPSKTKNSSATAKTKKQTARREAALTVPPPAPLELIRDLVECIEANKDLAARPSLAGCYDWQAALLTRSAIRRTRNPEAVLTVLVECARSPVVGGCASDAEALLERASCILALGLAEGDTHTVLGMVAWTAQTSGAPQAHVLNAAFQLALERKPGRRTKPAVWTADNIEAAERYVSTAAANLARSAYRDAWEQETCGCKAAVSGDAAATAFVEALAEGLAKLPGATSSELAMLTIDSTAADVEAAVDSVLPSLALNAGEFAEELELLYEGSAIQPSNIAAELSLGGRALAASRAIRGAVRTGLKWQALVEFLEQESLAFRNHTSPQLARLHSLLDEGFRRPRLQSDDHELEKVRDAQVDLVDQLAKEDGTLAAGLAAVAARAAWMLSSNDRSAALTPDLCPASAAFVKRNEEAFAADFSNRYVKVMASANRAQIALERIQALAATSGATTAV